MIKSIFHSLVCPLVVWVFLGLTLPQSVYAVYIYHTLPTQSLLPVATVHCIFQDSEGFMWYGTNGGGLCRDNGYQIDVFRSDNRTPGLLLNNNVSCIAEDSAKCIWFGTGKRLYRLDKKDYHLSEVIFHQDVNVTTLFLDTHRNMWVGTSDGFYCIDPIQQKVLVHIPVKRGVKQILEDHLHRMWIVPLEDAPFLYKKGKVTKVPWTLSSSIVRMVEDVSQHGFWVATWGDGLAFYDTRSGKATIQPQTNVEAQAWCVDLLIDKTQGMLWVTTLDNLYLYRREGNRLVALNTNDFLPAGSKILDGLCEDRMGNIWVSGFTPHTFVISNTKQEILKETVPLMRKLTSFPLLPDRMVAEGNGNYWIWQGRIGLMFYEPSTERLDVAGGMRIDRGIAKDRNASGIWAFEGTILKHIEEVRGQVEEVNVASFPNCINRVMDDGDGIVWVGTQDAVYQYHVADRSVKKLCNSEAKVIAMERASDGTLYFSNVKKQLFSCTKGGKLQMLENPRHENFTALAAAPDGTLWCVTEQGSVYSLTPGGTTLEYNMQMSNSNGDAIIDVKVDRVGHVWLLSNQYLREYNPRNNAFRTLRSTDPEIGVSYFYKLEYVDDNGIAADGAGAYLYFKSSKMLDQQTVENAQPYVTTIEMGDTIQLLSTYGRDIEIPAHVHSLVLKCSTFDPINAGKVSFAYKIEGWNKDWVYLPEGVNTIYLNNLPKGKNRLLLRATNRYGCWSTEETEYTLHRLPKWWETWWALLVYALLAINIIYGLRKLNHRIRLLMVLQQKRKSISLTEVQVKPEELVKDDEHTEKFLKQMVEKIESHLADGSYGVEQLSSDMCMSRMSLYRKVQAMSGLSPNEFIRDIRLKKAAAILQNHPEIAVSQLAAMVGFASPQYFSKCFRNQFGVQPSQYIKNEHIKDKKIIKPK